MEKKSLYLISVMILILSLALAGCGGGEGATQPEGAPAEEGQQQDAGGFTSDELASVPVGKTVTNLEDIEGTWIAAAYPGNFVLTIFPDGKLSVATSLENLQQGVTDSWQLTLEDGQIEATGYALCLGDVGSYVATLQDDGTLRFTSVIDACDARLRKMDRSLPGRLNEYILIYYPVD